MDCASSRQRCSVPTPTPISRATTSIASLSGGSNRATALSLYACPYRAISVLLRRPRVLGSIEATTILTRGEESFGQLWDYQREGWARRCFDNWRDALKWQRLKPYEKFAEMIEPHWDGIAAYCRPENKVSLGFVEGSNNKIRVIQRRAYGIRDEEYLRLKILTSTLPDP